MLDRITEHVDNM